MLDAALDPDWRHGAMSATVTARASTPPRSNLGAVLANYRAAGVRYFALLDGSTTATRWPGGRHDGDAAATVELGVPSTRSRRAWADPTTGRRDDLAESAGLGGEGNAARASADYTVEITVGFGMSRADLSLSGSAVAGQASYVDTLNPVRRGTRTPRQNDVAPSQPPRTERRISGR